MNYKLNPFTKKELRGDFYPMFLNLMKHGFEIEAFILILSTWNFARFRYAVRDFSLDKFKKVVGDLEPLFRKFKEEDFKTINFDEYSKDVKKIFQTLAGIKGVEKTGAAKLMHLKAPKVFVMWDGYIRTYYGFRKGDANEYFEFLKLMQRLFGNARTSGARTLPKLIDEHNYRTITEPTLKRSRK